MSTANQAKADFATAIKLAGLVLEGDPVMDGTFHRLPVVNAKGHAKDGTYVGFLDGRPSGHIQNFRTGHKETWTSEGPQLDGDQRMLREAQMLLAKERRADDLLAQHRQAADRVAARWETLSTTPENGSNPYLKRKGVEAHGVRFDRGVLVVPARDIDGKLWSLQSISSAEDGAKRFEKGARKAGTLHVIGELRSDHPILVAEGYATAATLHQASGQAVVVAFDAGSLDAVTGALRQRYPTSLIVVMGDDDRHRLPNVGVEKATAAARRHGASVAFPQFRAEGSGTDFNDLQALEGLPAVKAQVENALNQRTTPTPEQSAAPTKTQAPPTIDPTPGAGDSAESPPKRFTVALVDREGKPVEQLHIDDAASAVLAYATQTQTPFGPVHGRGSYVALTDLEGRLSAAKVYEGLGGYTMRFSTSEGRLAYEAIVLNAPGLEYPVDRPGSPARALSPQRDDAVGKPSADADRLSPRDVAVGGAHVTQLAQVGSPVVRAAAQAVGVADAVKVGLDVAQGKEVRPIDAAAAAASVTLSSGLGGPVVQALAQGVAGVSAIDAGRRAVNTLDDKSSLLPRSVQPDPAARRDAEVATASFKSATPEASPEQLEAATAWARETSKQFGEQLYRGQTESLQAISRGHAATLPVPRDTVTRSEADLWVAADLASLKAIDDTALRREAGNTMSLNAQEQIQYKAALVAQSPEAASEVTRLFRETQQSLLESTRREPWQQDFEANQMAARYATLRAEQRTVADLSPEKIERLASEDFRSLAVLRGHAGEAEAKALAGESLKNIAYRSAYEREATDASRIDVAELVGSRREAPAPLDRQATPPSASPRNTIEYVDPRSLDVETPDSAALRRRSVGQSSQSDARGIEAALLAAEAEPLARTSPLSVPSTRPRIDTEPDRTAPRSGVPPLEDRFNVIKHLSHREYQFRDQPGRVAFTERWLSMQSTVDTPGVVKAMVDRVQERGWTAIRVKGAPEFERQTWIAATARGIKAVGYQPTDLDRAAANEERARLAGERESAPLKAGGTITREPERDRAVATPAEPAPRRDAQADRSSEARVVEPPVARPLAALLAQRGDSPGDAASIVAAATELVKGKRVHVGQVVGHGTADYKFDAKNEPSYYVKLATPRGEQTIWGVDLNRALVDTGIKVGDNVVLEHRGRQPVTVATKEYDAGGQYVGQRDVTAARATWFAAGVDQLRDQAALARPRTLQQAADVPLSQDGAAPKAVRGEPLTVASPVAPAPARAEVSKPSLVQEPRVREAQVFALLEATFESQKVPESLRARLRDDVTRGLGERKALGDVPRVKVYDPEATRQVPRAVIPPQRQREALDRAR